MSHYEVWEPGKGNPYGLPGDGNFDVAWRALLTPCTQCNTHHKAMEIKGNKILVTCVGDDIDASDGRRRFY